MNVRYLCLQNGDALPALGGLSPYKAVLVIEDVVDSEWKAAVSRWLADSGCLYMMAWGKECKSWHDSVDLARDQLTYGELPDDKFIMTTWHDDEPLEEVFGFAKYAAHHPTIELENVLFLHIGAAERKNELEDMYRNAS